MTERRNPYEVLDVPSGCNSARITAAYRSKAKSAHPDAGGSEEEFLEVQHAYLVLKDPERRARFDQTGDQSEQAVDNELASILEEISGYLLRAADKVDEPGILQLDFLSQMRSAIQEEKRGPQEALERIESTVKRLKKLKGRFEIDPEHGENRIEALIDNHIRMAGREKESCERNLRRIDRMLEILKPYRFKTDKKDPRYKNLGFASKFPYAGA